MVEIAFSKAIDYDLHQQVFNNGQLSTNNQFWMRNFNMGFHGMIALNLLCLTKPFHKVDRWHI
jgi:hypothetical protein